MGRYLNPGADRLIQARRSKIYVDKSSILSFLNNVFYTESKYICISRPRRFGKTMAAGMVSAYYDRTVDGAKEFAGLKISKDKTFDEFRNKCDVLFLNIQDFLSESSSVEEMIDKIKKVLIWELNQEYKDLSVFDRENLSNFMADISTKTNRRFVIVIDEWDCIFREYRDSEMQKKYLDFLRWWLKDKTYIGLVYMTGILPIKKYGSHSALNMFREFSMTNAAELAESVGFTEDECKSLCKEYNVDFETLKRWYDGYKLHGGAPDFTPFSIYNPKSVVTAVTSGIFDAYWNKTETFEALKVYIDMNFDGLRDTVISLISGSPCKINTGTFSNDMETFSTKDDVLTLLVHLGYLAYDEDRSSVSIPNYEIQCEWANSITVGGWDKVAEAIKSSEKLLQDTWAGKEAAVAEGISKAHLETSHLQYNDENALSYTISLAYFAARDYYTIVRELPAGEGFADLAFIPRKNAADKPALLIELKWNKDAETAITQIHNKKYPVALEEWKGNLMLVGINYDKDSRQHECKIDKG